MYWYIKIADAKNKDFDKILLDVLIEKTIGIDFKIDRDYNSFSNVNEWNDYLDSKCSTRNQYLALKRVFNTFINEIKVDDFVFLCSGSNKIHYICQVAGDYEFDRTFLHKYYSDTSLCHRRKIKNIVKFDATAPKQMRCTIYRV